MTERPTIWHNPRCSKSRQAFEIIKEMGFEPRVVRYLDDPPDAKTLRAVLDGLGLEPRALMRTKEDLYKTLGLSAVTHREALIDAMVKNPKLIERPVVLYKGKVALGRPPARVRELLGG